MAKELFEFSDRYREAKPAPLATNHTLERGKAFLELITRISVENRAIALSIVNQFDLYDYNDYKTSQDGVRRHVYCHSVRYKQETGETWQFIVEAPKTAKGYRYLAPAKIGNKALLPDVPRDIRKAIGKRNGVKVPLEGSFWAWYEQNKQIPLDITEGGGKGLAGLSHAFVAIALYGCSCLGSPDLLPYIKGRDIRIAFDSDTKPSAVKAVKQALFKHLKPLSKLAKSVKVVTWDSKNKGLDDLLASGGAGAYATAIATAKSADDWLFEQNVEIARQRLEISDKLTHDIEITHDEFKALTHESLKALTGNARDIAINAFTRAGKTEFAAKIIANYLYAIAPFHRKALAKSASGDLGLTYRTDCDRNGKDLITTEGYVTKLGLCNEAVISLISAINGLLGKGAFAFGDEFDQQLESLALSSTHGKDGRRRLHQRTFEDIFKMAVQTLITSADLTDYEINQFHKMTGRKPFVIKVKTVKKGYKAFMYQQFADFWQKFHEARLQGKRILVLCTRKEDAKFLAYAYGAVAVHADNSGDYQDLLDKPNTWLPNNKPILMAVSPVFGTGFSIKVDAFDYVFGWFKADNIPAKGLIQFLNRYRPDVERHIYCDYSSGRFDGLTSDELFKTRLAKAKAQKVNEGEASFINPDDPYFHYKAETNWSLAHLRADLFARLERDVETVEYMRSQLSEKERKAVTKELTAKLKEYRATYPVNVFEGDNYTLEQYLAKKDEPNLSERERLAITKFEIADWSCLTPDQLTLERVQRDRKGKKRKAVSNLEMQSFPQIAVAIDKSSVEKQTKHGEGIAHQDISHHALRVEALDKLGIGEVLDFILSGNSWSAITVQVESFTQKLIDSRDALAKMDIKLTCGKNATINAVFGALLKNYFGLETVRSQLQSTTGKKYSVYRLDTKDLELTKTDLIARLKRNVEKYGELKADPQKAFVERLYGSHTPLVNSDIQEVCDQPQTVIEKEIKPIEKIVNPTSMNIPTEAIAPGPIAQQTPKEDLQPMVIAPNIPLFHEVVSPQPHQNESLYDRIRRLNEPLTEFCQVAYQAAAGY
ncbi:MULTISPECIES: DUF3854 domain-containing protein [Pseudanabaena]|uniref:DUF3854 domain-containing protein n=1 Tax=Pseudanabaena TaxID=1152 RepID=UPI00247AED56|nr:MULTISPECIES: DUF3854 domain-containing protein [Pseudanabaena]MEA5487107.1 DUF3854 domain-containing protein [Pseudanabaena sp. CCNP1317]WGS74822.1 DUF3854 domain-containing protein [Pseudanabaena galeata CCNP1313]